jgi:hypothetical protein
MLKIKRDKSLDQTTSTEFVKYFINKYRQELKVDYPVNYARDCVIMSQILDKFHNADKSRKEVFVFIDEMFKSYNDRPRSLPIDVRFLLAAAPSYFKNGGDLASKKVKNSKIEITPELREWLLKEKEKWAKKSKC